MSSLARAPLALLLAAAGLSAQTVITLDGASGNELYATDYTLNATTVFGLNFQAEYLVVAGGGGGGGSGTDTTAWGSGGGGAGGLLTGTLGLGASSYSVAVGAGGAGGVRNGNASLQVGGNGGNSTFSTVTAIGGGGGGAYKIAGSTGGSGGGGGGRGTGNNLRTAGGAATSGQGFAGGATRDDDSSGRVAGGGGGGAGAVGGTGGTNTSVAGSGGAGLASSISGASVTYAGGGGGGAWDAFEGETAGSGGAGGGGAGSTSGNATAGTNGLGGGGGGVGTQGVGGAGGSGVVIVRYKGEAAGTGGVVAAGTGTAAGYTVHTFSTVGAAALNLSGLDLGSRLGATLSGRFTGSGTLAFNNATVTGPSRFTITGDSSSTHTGIVMVNSGATVTVGDGATSGRLGTGDLYINQGGTLVFDRSDDVTVSNTLRTSESDGNNAGTIVKRGAGKLTLTGNNANHAGLLKVEQGTMAYDQTTRYGTATVRAEVAAGATFNLVDNTPSAYGGYGSMRLETSGDGQFVFSGVNRRALSVAVPGNQWLNHTSSLAHTGGTVIDGAGLSLGSGQALAAGSDLVIRGSGSLLSSASLALGSVVVESGTLHLGAQSLSADSLEVREGSLTASLTSATDLLKTGSGTLVFDTRASNRTSATRVEGGVLQVYSGAALGAGEVTLAGGTLRITSGSQYNPQTVQVSTLVLDGGAVETTAQTASRLAATTLDLRSGTVALRLSGTGSLSKTTAGTVLLSGDNSAYAGAVTVSDGVLQLGTATSLGSASVVLSGGTIELSGSTIVGYFEQTGGTVTGGTLISSQILTESGTLDSVIADGVTVINFSPRIINAGILKRTAGVTEVTAANTFTGVVNVQAGTLRLAGEGAFASASSLATRQGGTLDLNGKSQTLRGIGGDGAITLGAGGALTVSSVSDSVFDGTLSGAGTLTKSGAGTLTLTGAASHTGATAVTGGKLVVNGTLGSGDLTVAYGSVLGGSGTIGGDTVISGGHTPGNSPGIQTFSGNLTYDATSQVLWEIGDNTESNSAAVMFDQIVVGLDLVFAAGATFSLSFDPTTTASAVDWSDAFWQSNRSWLVFDVAGDTTGLGGVTLNVQDWLDGQGDSFDTVLGGSFSLSQVGSDVYLNYTAAVPEPSTYGLLLGALALAGAASRRRRKKD